MAKVQCMAKVVRAEQLAEGIFSMWLLAPEIAEQAVPGQFISLYCEDSDKLLPRPISLCEVDKVTGQLRIVYRVVGAGTKEFSQKKAEDEIRILGPLGNGFPLDDVSENGEAVLIGGGIGIPPMLQLAKQLSCHVTVVVGYRDADTFLLEELREAADRVVIATEDGSIGTKGNVIDAIRAENVHADVIYSCGPTPMLRGVKAWGLEENVNAWISMEEKMACGIGACLACVCKSTDVDSHSNVNNKRVCKDGPVFLSTEIEL
ncbi:MAG: dihydroorotate dehydrogenase electron transfer subunit [Eubacterium sp.]|nr:dihydroorotate dehydrogenase electron transfer subunit [Eubacterium sp.]